MSEASEMVERVTECLLAFEPSILNRSIAERLARAAIEEMREPTEGMLRVGHHPSWARSGFCWQDMIDAALKGVADG